ncbi:MAG: type II toxin-antitoxin system HicA family toxin [bacterium]
MVKHRKTLEQILRATSDANISFAGMCVLLRALGFEERVRGDHHIFTHVGIAEILNIQPRGALAKPYQVKQVRSVILEYGFGVKDDEQI